MVGHDFLALKTALIPQETKDNLPEYGSCLFSNDFIANGGEPSRVLIDGYNKSNQIVQAQITIDGWLQWSENTSGIIAILMHPDNIIRYTYNEYVTERDDINSIWYVDRTGDP